MPLARDGFPMIGAATALAVAAFVVSLGTTGVAQVVATGLAGVFLVLALFLVNFFRDPERRPEGGDDAIISPADGRIIAVEAAARESRYLDATVAKVCIFMSPLDVHVNRSPMDGEVTGVFYNPGEYFAAYSDKASLDNEQNAIVMKTAGGRRLAYVQIAGFLARRIVCRVAAGDVCQKGQRIGMIKLGSRVDVFVEGDVDLSVQVGDRVKAGQTVLGVVR